MKLHKKSAFTLIELIIAVTAFCVIALTAIAPYNHYINKAKLKQTDKEVSQMLYEARNMAINGISSWSGNLSVAVYFDAHNGANETINILTMPHNFTDDKIDRIAWAQIALHKTYKLPKWVKIKKVAWKDNALFYFDAITGNGKYFHWNASGVREDLTSNTIEVAYNYKDSDKSIFNRSIEYYTQTNIVDY